MILLQGLLGLAVNTLPLPGDGAEGDWEGGRGGGGLQEGCFSEFLVLVAHVHLHFQQSEMEAF